MTLIQISALIVAALPALVVLLFIGAKKYLLTLLCRFLVRLHAPLTRDPLLWGLYVALVFIGAKLQETIEGRLP